MLQPPYAGPRQANATWQNTALEIRRFALRILSSLMELLVQEQELAKVGYVMGLAQMILDVHLLEVFVVEICHIIVL